MMKNILVNGNANDKASSGNNNTSKEENIDVNENNSARSSQWNASINWNESLNDDDSHSINGDSITTKSDTNINDATIDTDSWESFYPKQNNVQEQELSNETIEKSSHNDINTRSRLQSKRFYRMQESKKDR